VKRGRPPKLDWSAIVREMDAGAGASTIAAKYRVHVRTVQKRYMAEKWHLSAAPAGAGNGHGGAAPGDEAFARASSAAAGKDESVSPSPLGSGAAGTPTAAPLYSSKEDEDFVVSVAAVVKSGSIGGLSLALWGVNLRDPRAASLLALLPNTITLLKTCAPALAPKLRELLNSWILGAIVMGYDGAITAAAMYGVAQQQRREAAARKASAQARPPEAAAPASSLPVEGARPA